ncbi:MAG: AsmA family protein [Burkholderiales bacterium]|nr:AsmA family protein [Burkholderiales bacterium]
MKALKYVLFAVGGVILLAIIAVAIVAATFDPGKYKPEIVKLVKERTGRTLAIDGRIGLTFFPKIGATVGKVSLSEPWSDKVFARVGDARVAVALIPLLSKRVVVDRVTLSGLAVDLVRYKDGRTNFGDLAGAPPAKPGEPPKPAPPAGAPVIDIGGIALTDANIGWRDERDGTQLRVSKLDLDTGRIASGVPGKLALTGHVEGPQPKVDLDVALATGYRIDFQTLATALSGLDLKASGNAPGFAGFEATAKGDVALDPKAERIDLSGFVLAAKSKDGLEARFSVPKLALSPEAASSQAIDGAVRLIRGDQAIDAKLALSTAEAKGKQVEFASLSADVNVKQGALAVQGRIATPVSLNLAQSQARLPKIAGDLALTGPDVPGKSVKLALAGSAGADWAKQTAEADLVAKLEDSTINAKLAVASLAAPAISFDVAADRLNVDRYLPPKTAARGGGGAATSGGDAAKGGAGGAGAEQPIDLSALKTLNANGTVRIGALTASNIKAQNVRVDVRAAGGRLNVDPIAANLYQGTLAGAASVNANANTFATRQQLKGISIGPLLRDAAQKDVLEGRGTVNLDVTTAGGTASALKRGLNGTASLDLRDGAIKGVDIGAVLRKAQSLLSAKGALEEPAKGGDQTDFSELSASFVIKNGIAYNDDLQGKSPLLRLGGAGTIDIGAGTVDYTVKASLVATAKGQGGRDVSQLHGVTVPVKLSGPFDNLKYRVDVTALAADAAKGALAQELERRLGGGKADGQQQGGEQKGGSIGDALRGLLRR